MSIIAGISTPIGSGAISIVRVSGEGALTLALRFFSCEKLKQSSPVPNYMYLGVFNGGDFRDRCMLVYFAAPRSYTGEDMVEFQLHGGVRLTQNVLHTLLNAGAVSATRGEFSRRAFLNGKITLDEAEGILGLIDAESNAEITAAYGVMRGVVSERVRPIAEKLGRLVGMLEAWFDYPDEMEDEVNSDILPEMHEIEGALSTLSATAARGKLVKNGVSVALVGKPNVGKSSLLNAILGEDRAIVTEQAGTTRDVISESLIYKNIRINLLDTAGLRECSDLAEQLGVQRTTTAAAAADVVIYLLDGAVREQTDAEIISKCTHGKLIIVNNKSDVNSPDNGYPCISAKQGTGIEWLLDRIVEEVSDSSMYGELLTMDRHIDAVRRALAEVQGAISAYGSITLDCLTVNLKAAYAALCEIDGATATEQIIDEIFSRFCVGK